VGQWTLTPLAVGAVAHRRFGTGRVVRPTPAHVAAMSIPIRRQAHLRHQAPTPYVMLPAQVHADAASVPGGEAAASAATPVVVDTAQQVAQQAAAIAPTSDLTALGLGSWHTCVAGG